MSDYNIHLKWVRETGDFDYQTYNRKHTVFFYGGPKIEVDSSSNYIRNPQFHSPEELLAASLSSCFLLTFLALCSKKGYVIDHYSDHVTCKVDERRMIITDISLHPVVAFGEDISIDKKTMIKLFETTHRHCFIANSLKVPITVNPEFEKPKINE
ncbi:peroxiredoxin, OsmC subfamily [Legionella massiliensis]|uniref:Peroxiredoxin, OsmC subfamily n=1 Tax=Legionella massiliensis TaxID=1034943 RepID=A0A078KU53_9GAMM|nr:OsmC family protein [Legionella massiliensis]CDZ76507.1 peroxiredoxin, OsmC subfamily [Legionella massiliensis]CEE12245.1 OsmC-like protein [Legionella massiliensis]